MTSRIHFVMTEEEKARMEGAARRLGMTLSAWLREAAREKMERSAPRSLSEEGDLRAFFADCDHRESGAEPDWGAHRKVIETSRRPTDGVP